MAVMTVSGNEITDATRLASAAGDGRAADSSFGIWEAATNLIVNGGFETDSTGVSPASWTAFSATISAQSTAKFGSKGMRVITSNLVANEGAYVGFTGALATPYTASAWVRGSGTVQIGIQDNGVVRAVSAPVALTGTFQRISISLSALTTTTSPRVVIQTDVKQNVTYFVDGVQIEAKAYATPYVDTNGATATRAAANVQGSFAYFSEVQSWFAVRFRFGAVTGTLQNLFTAQDTSTGTYNRIMLFNDGTNYTIQHYRNNVLQTGVTVAGVPTVGTTVTLVVAWTNTTMKLSVNGGAFVSQSRGAAGGTGTQLIQSTFAIGYYSGFFYPDGDVLWTCGGTGTLTDADAGTINSYGNTDPIAFLQYLNGGVAYPTLIWTGIDANYNQAGFDPGLKMRCIKGYFDAPPNLNNYSMMIDDVYQNFAGYHRNLSCEVESNQALIAFTPQVGLPGQAYPIGSRFSAVPTSPMMFDFTAGTHAAGYTAYLREDWSVPSRFSPVPTNYYWNAFTEYQDKGGGGVFMGYASSAVTQINAIFGASPDTNPSGLIAVTGATVTVGGTYTAGVPTILFSGGTLAPGGAQATGHAVMNAAGTAVSAVLIDTPGSYSSVAGLSIGFSGGTFSVPASASAITGTGSLFRAIVGLLFTYPVFNVAAIPMISGGSGYTSAPTVVFSGGTGGGATAVAVLGTGLTADKVIRVDVTNPGSYTAAPSVSFSGGGGALASASVTMQTVQFFGAIDLNMYVKPGFPKDAIYSTNAEPKVRACVQGTSPAWYGFASVDAISYAGLDLALNAGSLVSKTITWSAVLTYLTTTMDQKVGSNLITPNGASGTPYMPRPLNGLSSVLIKGFNCAIECNVPVVGNTLALDYGFGPGTPPIMGMLTTY